MAVENNTYAIFIDIDGTLRGASSAALEKNLGVIKKVRALGHKVFISTGRAISYMPSEISYENNFDGIVAAAGSYVRLGKDELFKKFQSYKAIMNVCEFFLENNVNGALEGEKSVYYFSEAETLEEENWIKIDKNNLSSTINEDVNIFKFLIVGSLPEKIREIFGEEHRIMVHDGYCEIVLTECNKAHGIEIILKALDIPRERSIAIGDSLNDLEMIEYAGIGIAMGNSISEIKKVADFITDDVDDAGVATALAKIFNIKL